MSESDTQATEAPSRRRRWLRLGLGALLFGVAAVGLGPAFLPARGLGAFVAGQVEGVLGTPVRIERAWLWPWAGVWLDGVTLHAEDADGGPPPFEARRIHLALSPWTWLDGTLEVDALEVDGLSVRLVRVDGRWRLPGTPGPSQKAPARGQTGLELPVPVQVTRVSVDVKEVRVDDGSQRFEAGPTALWAQARAEGSQVDVKAWLLSTPVATEGDGPVPAPADLRLGTFTEVQLDLAHDQPLRQAQVQLDASLAHDGLSGRVSSTSRMSFVEADADVRLRVEGEGQLLSAHARASNLRSLLVRKLGWAGGSWADAAGLGPPREGDAQVELEVDGSLELGALPVPAVERVAGHANLDGLRAAWGSNGLSGSGSARVRGLELESEWATIRGLNLDLALGADRPDGQPARGLGQVDGRWLDLDVPGLRCVEGSLVSRIAVEAEGEAGGDVHAELACGGLMAPSTRLVQVQARLDGTNVRLGRPGLPPGLWVGTATLAQGAVADTRLDRSTVRFRLSPDGAADRDAPKDSDREEPTRRWAVDLRVRSAGARAMQTTVEGVLARASGRVGWPGTWPGSALDVDAKTSLQIARVEQEGVQARNVRSSLSATGSGFRTRPGWVPYGPGRGRIGARTTFGTLRLGASRWDGAQVEVQAQHSGRWSAQARATLPEGGEVRAKAEDLNLDGGPTSGAVQVAMDSPRVDAWTEPLRDLLGDAFAVNGAAGGLAFRSRVELDDWTLEAPQDGLRRVWLRFETEGLSVFTSQGDVEGLAGRFEGEWRGLRLEGEGRLYARALASRVGWPVRIEGVGLNLAGRSAGRRNRLELGLVLGPGRVPEYGQWQEARLELVGRTDRRSFEVERLAVHLPWDGVTVAGGATVSAPDGGGPWDVRGALTVDADGARLADALDFLDEGAGTLGIRLALAPEGPKLAQIGGEVVCRQLTLMGPDWGIQRLNGVMPIEQALVLPEPPRRVLIASSDRQAWLDRATQALLRYTQARVRLDDANILVDSPRTADYDTLRPYQQSPVAPHMTAAELRLGGASMTDLALESRWDEGLMLVERLSFRIWQGDALMDLAVQLTAEPNLRLRLRGTLTGINLDIPYALVEDRPADLSPNNPYTTSMVLDFGLGLKERKLDGTADLLRVTEPLLLRAFGALELESAKAALVWLRQAEVLGVRPTRGKIWVKNNLLSVGFDWQRLFVHVAYRNPIPKLWLLIVDTALIPGRWVTIPTVGASVINIVDNAVRRFSIGGILDRYLQAPNRYLTFTAAFTEEYGKAPTEPLE